jgi:hypothetical protein
MEPLLLISEKLRMIQKGELDMDLQKGKGNRDGLIQQIVTYVRDGHTITRKQWVRSEFADHAKKNEEEKKDTLLKEQERKENKRKKDLHDENEKQITQDKRARKRVEKLKEKEEVHGHHSRNKKVNSDKVDEYKKRLEEQRKKNADEDKKKKDKKKDEDKKKKGHSAYGQQDRTKADNKAEQDMITKPK